MYLLQLTKMLKNLSGMRAGTQDILLVKLSAYNFFFCLFIRKNICKTKSWGCGLVQSACLANPSSWLQLPALPTSKVL